MFAQPIRITFCGICCSPRAGLLCCWAIWKNMFFVVVVRVVIVREWVQVFHDNGLHNSLFVGYHHASTYNKCSHSLLHYAGLFAHLMRVYLCSLPSETIMIFVFMFVVYLFENGCIFRDNELYNPMFAACHHASTYNTRLHSLCLLDLYVGFGMQRTANYVTHCREKLASICEQIYNEQQYKNHDFF